MGSAVIDVLIGLVMVFLLMSLVCSTISEQISAALCRRQRMLLKGIRELLQDEDLVDAFYKHPRIWSLYRGEYDQAKKTGKLPSYIPTEAFSAAIIDIAARGRDPSNAVHAGPEAPVLSLDLLRRNVGNIGTPQVQRLMISAIDSAQGDIKKVKESIDAWFDGTMDRVAGWYKREVQLSLFVIGAVLTIVIDVDTIEIARDLYKDPARRQAAVAMATAVTQQSRTAGTMSDSLALGRIAKAAMDSLHGLGIPVAWADVDVAGWPKTGSSWSAIGGHALRSSSGWLITAVAISFGAPFWFDLLNKVMVIRSTVKPREKSREEGTEDRRSAPAAASAQSTAPPPVVLPAGANVGVTSPSGRGATREFRSHEWATGNADGGIL
jgi:hypothetical protein